MSHPSVDDLFYDNPRSPMILSNGDALKHSRARSRNSADAIPASEERFAAPRRTPRKSLIVVLGESSAIPVDAVTKQLRAVAGADVDVIVAYAGQPGNLARLQGQLPDFQVLLAPAGTSTDDLRELAIHHAPGDIVTLVSEFPIAMMRSNENPAQTEMLRNA